MVVQANSSFLREMADDLHDLCQPLTALQFYLETARSSTEGEALKDALDGSLEEMRRLTSVVQQMRNHLLREETTAMAIAAQTHQAHQRDTK